MPPIGKLPPVMRSGAALIMEIHVLPEESTQSHFIEGAFRDDVTNWWVFGAECLMGMQRSAGFKDVHMSLKAKCDNRHPLDSKVAVEGCLAAGGAWFSASKNLADLKI